MESQPKKLTLANIFWNYLEYNDNESRAEKLIRQVLYGVVGRDRETGEALAIARVDPNCRVFRAYDLAARYNSQNGAPIAEIFPFELLGKLEHIPSNEALSESEQAQMDRIWSVRQLFNEECLF